MIDTNYRAFISYNHLDRSKVVWLQSRLESYRVPRKLVDLMTSEGSVPRRLTPIFRDEVCMAVGDLSDGVKEALRKSRFLIVACSPNAANSDWVDREIRLFKSIHRERADNRILAAIVQGPDGETVGDPLVVDPVIPEACKFRTRSDGTLSDEVYEPLAADLRFGGKYAKKGLLKLISGLIGVGLDDLLDRDHRRRIAYSRAAGGVAAAAAVFTGGLASVAINARNEAREQREEAEGLVEFMLTDLKERLDAVGRLDALDAVGERALKYYAAQNKSRLDADSLGRRARAQLLVGEIDNLRGDLDAALTAYEEAAATTEEQLRRNPSNAQRLFDHAQSVFWVGYIAWQRGDLQTAKLQMTEYERLARRLVEIDPTKREWRLELGYAFSNLGTLAEEARDNDQARIYFQKSAEIKEALLADEPNDVSLILGLGQSYSWLARVEKVTGRFDEAEERILKELALYEPLLRRDPNNARIIDPWTVAIPALSDVQLAKGDLPNAALTILRAADAIEALVDLEPENVAFRTRQVRYLIKLADIRRYQNDYAASSLAATAAQRIVTDLRGKDQSVAEWRLDEISALSAVLASDASGATHPHEARRLLDILRAQDAAGGPEIGGALALGYLRLGRWAAREGDSLGGGSKALFERGLETIGREDAAVDLARETTRVALLIELDRREEAEKIAARLTAQSYNHPEFASLNRRLSSSRSARKQE